MTTLFATGIVATMTILSGSIGTGTVSLQQLPVSCIQATDECGNMCNRAKGQKSWACTKMACVTKQDAVCLATADDEVTSQVPTMCTMQYKPVCGEKQVQCITASCDPIRQTYGNSCMAAADQATVIFEGECNIAETGSIVLGDKNEYGCIGSAGYIWSQDTQQCIRPGEEKQNVVTWAYGLGITKFKTLTDFNWDAFVTREQAAKMIMTAIDVFGVSEGIIKQPEGSCVWTDVDMIDNSLLPMVAKSCIKGLFKGSNGKFMPRAYLTNTDAMTVMTRATQYIPALADMMTRSKFVITGNFLTRGELLSRIQGLMMNIQPTQSEVDFAQAQQDLDTARALWNSKKITTYSLIQTRSCFCMEDYTRPMKYEISNDIIDMSSLVYADNGNKVTIETQLNTVNQAFDMIQEAIDNKVANLTVEYDAATGYPTSIAIDKDFMIADEEIYYNYKLITNDNIILSGDYYLESHNGQAISLTGVTLSFTDTHMYVKVCNNLNASYQATDSTIKFGPMISTMMYCNNKIVMNIESLIDAWGSIDYTLDNTSITMKTSTDTFIWNKK